MASDRNGTLYVGVTSSLSRRITGHREGRGSDFVRQYNVTCLVYAEAYERADEAIAQEKRIKRWSRA
ncbi:GIY-YIG nuclease family protein [Bosea psychrotolerans]|uniref:GIY-YIG nuclease family protein n=1 Tax=Bosea psychrotolerans TaxID=1871628 RepID=UPI000CDA84CA|nr:GIY-YIG nuclease family protein [Bosea psychrotolerans]